MNTSLLATTDKTIRPVLLDELRKRYHTSDTAIIPEFTLSDTGTRADVAVVNGILHGYELKGDLDTLKRLPSQIDGYNAIFDKITIVVGKKHILNSICEIPDWWGVTLAKEVGYQIKPELIEVRKAGINPNQDIFAVISLLWKDEIIEILRKKNIYNHLSSATKNELCNVLIEKLDVVTLKTQIRSSIVSRRNA